MDQTTETGVLRPLFEGFFTLFPHAFYLPLLEAWTAVINAFLGIFGIPPIFIAL